MRLVVRHQHQKMRKSARRALKPKLSSLIAVWNFTLMYQPILFSLTSWYSWTCSMPRTRRDELLSTRNVPRDDWQRTEMPISLKMKLELMVFKNELTLEVLDETTWRRVACCPNRDKSLPERASAAFAPQDLFSQSWQSSQSGWSIF